MIIPKIAASAQANRLLLVLAAAVALALLAVACDEDDPVVVGTANSTEQQILGLITVDLLQRTKIDANYQLNPDAPIPIGDAWETLDVDVYWDSLQETSTRTGQQGVADSYEACEQLNQRDDNLAPRWYCEPGLSFAPVFFPQSPPREDGIEVQTILSVVSDNMNDDVLSDLTLRHEEEGKSLENVAHKFVDFLCRTVITCH